MFSLPSQDNIKKHIKVLEETTLLVNKLELFSTNESLDDLQTGYLKFLLIPAFLGYLTLKQVGESSREELIRIGKVYFVDYLNRLNSYKIIDLDVKRLIERNENEFFPKSQPSLEQLAKERNEKLRLYNESKQLDEKLAKLSYILDDHEGNKVDEDVVRDFFLSFIRRWVNRIVDEIKSISMEEIMLRNRPKIADRPRTTQSAANFQPFIITKNEMQKKVFGLGYPSRPTVTIEEFVNQKIEEGSLSVTTDEYVCWMRDLWCLLICFLLSLAFSYKNSLQKWAEDPEAKNQDDEKDDAEKDRLVDKDDEFNLQRSRAWDDWKDGECVLRCPRQLAGVFFQLIFFNSLIRTGLLITFFFRQNFFRLEHKRGEGNRMNMG